jgi:hypothetical protein
VVVQEMASSAGCEVANDTSSDPSLDASISLITDEALPIYQPSKSAASMTVGELAAKVLERQKISRQSSSLPPALASNKASLNAMVPFECEGYSTKLPSTLSLRVLELLNNTSLNGSLLNAKNTSLL